MDKNKNNEKYNDDVEIELDKRSIKMNCVYNDKRL
jgi:hypothetical protein